MLLITFRITDSKKHCVGRRLSRHPKLLQPHGMCLLALQDRLRTFWAFHPIYKGNLEVKCSESWEHHSHSQGLHFDFSRHSINHLHGWQNKGVSLLSYLTRLNTTSFLCLTLIFWFLKYWCSFLSVQYVLYQSWQFTSSSKSQQSEKVTPPK